MWNGLVLSQRDSAIFRRSSRLLLLWYVTVFCFEGSLVSRRARLDDTDETRRSKHSRFDSPHFPLPPNNCDKNVRRTLCAAVNAIPAEALANSERMPDRGDTMGCEWRYRTARLQEISDRVLGRTPAHLQDEQHYELHSAAESLWFPQGDFPQPRSNLQFLQPARARVSAWQFSRRSCRPVIQGMPKDRWKEQMLAVRDYKKRGGESAITDELRIPLKTVSGTFAEYELQHKCKKTNSFWCHITKIFTWFFK